MPTNNLRHRFLLVLLGALLGAGCAGSGEAMRDASVTAEGRITVRGNAPFTAVMLETDQRNLYVLEADARALSALQTAGRATITGHVYTDIWNGRPHAHLRVTAWAPTP
ncbi:MAG: hypothetical protein AAF970_04945 [Bacteroidota bacterium]